MIIAQGGRFGGWTIFKDGRAKFVYNTLGIHAYATAADTAIPRGTHQVRMEFAYDGGGLAKESEQLASLLRRERRRHGEWRTPIR